MSEEKEYTLKELKTLLNDKQKKFCHRWIIDFNNVKSYMFAYPDSKYKSSSASADTLLENTRIKQYIKFIQKDIAKEAGITMLSQILRLKNIAEGNIAVFYEDWSKLKEFKDLTDEQKATLLEITHKKTKIGDTVIDIEFVKLKTHSPLEAIREINKMLGFYEPEKKDITTGGEKINNDFYFTADDFTD